VGRALSIGLARAGFDVAVHYNSSGREAESVAEEVRGLGRECLTVQGDLASASAIGSVMESVSARFDRLDFLVNNASTFHEQPLFEASAEQWDRVMAVNLRAPFLMTQAAAPRLRDCAGSVVNIVDVSAFQPWIRYPHHSVAKAGLLHLTRIMAKELAPRVRVNAVAPGTVLPPEGSDDQELERERDRTLVGHLGAPRDVVETVLFLEQSRFITGEVIVVDGGLRWG